MSEAVELYDWDRETLGHLQMTISAMHAAAAKARDSECYELEAFILRAIIDFMNQRDMSEAAMRGRAAKRPA